MAAVVMEVVAIVLSVAVQKEHGISEQSLGQSMDTQNGDEEDLDLYLHNSTSEHQISSDSDIDMDNDSMDSPITICNDLDVKYTSGDIVIIGLAKRWTPARFDKVMDDGYISVTHHKIDATGALLEQPLVEVFSKNSVIFSLGKNINTITTGLRTKIAHKFKNIFDY